MPGADAGEVGRGGGQARFQQAGPAAADRAVDRGEERSLAAARQAAGQLEIAPGGGVDLHEAAGPLLHRRPQERQAAALGQLQIIDERAERRHLGPREAAEARQFAGPERGGDPRLGSGGVEARPGEGGDDGPRLGDEVRKLGLQRFRHQDLAGGEAGEHRAEAGSRTGRDAEAAGGDIDPGEGALAADLGEGRQIVVAPGLEQAVLGQGARGDEAHHPAVDDGFRPALAGLGRVLHLLADGDAEALADQREEIGLGRMDRHPAHRDVLSEMLAALGQGDVERGARGFGIREEQLVEIAHAIEQERVRVVGLDGVVLGHHRRNGEGLGHAGSVVGGLRCISPAGRPPAPGRVQIFFTKEATFRRAPRLTGSGAPGEAAALNSHDHGWGTSCA